MSQQNYNKDVYGFFNALNAFAKVVDDALSKYINEEYDDVKTSDECPEDTCQQKCGACCECDAQCPPEQPCNNNTTSKTYKLDISDYSIENFEDAMKLIAPDLDDVVFAMRTGAYDNAKISCRFADVNYFLDWNKEADRLEGIEYHIIGETEIWVYYDELAQTMKRIEKKETAQESENKDNCPHRNDLFYPYGKECENCEHKSECFTTIDKVENDHDSESAVYDANGNAISEEEIPSLKDYAKDFTPTNKQVCDNAETCECETAKITGKYLHHTLNNEFKKTTDAYLNDVLNGVEKLLRSEIYTVLNSDVDNNGINTITFTLGQIKGCMTSAIPEDINKLIFAQTLAEAIQKRFEFKEVFIDGEDVHCTLI